jgi:transposase
MRFVAVESEASQASTTIFRTRDLLVRQRTQHINERKRLAEYGLVAAKKSANLPRLLHLIDQPGCNLPADGRAMLDVLLGMITVLDERIAQLDRKINQRAKAKDAGTSTKDLQKGA